ERLSDLGNGDRAQLVVGLKATGIDRGALLLQLPHELDQLLALAGLIEAVVVVDQESVRVLGARRLEGRDDEIDAAGARKHRVAEQRLSIVRERLVDDVPRAHGIAITLDDGADMSLDSPEQRL